MVDRKNPQEDGAAAAAPPLNGQPSDPASGREPGDRLDLNGNLFGGVQRSPTVDSNMSGRTILTHRRTMDPPAKEKWQDFITKIVRKERLRKVLAEWRKGVGQPCARCASMKLTESKFLIYEFAKHQRLDRGAANDNNPWKNTDELGPGGLEFGPKEFKLGTFKEMESRRETCPFCGLAVGSLEDGGFPNISQMQRDGQPIDPGDIICFASWQLDGRKFLRDQEGNITGSRACTRRIRLRWETADKAQGACVDTYVVLMAPKNTSSGLFLGQPIEAVKSDAALVRRWIKICEDAHGHRCQSHIQAPVSRPFFGVIDVKDMRLTKLPSGARYVALSYTWGTGAWRFQTKKGNIKDLKESGGLRTWKQHLPRTIRDAIELVIDLGEQYLWVDALCIVQDSDRSWALNSRVMDAVYGNAYLTICAADGDNANSGLRGLQGSHGQNRSVKQHIAQYGRDLRLMSTQPAENYIRQSTYETRGWTFQERLLSPRNLIFTGGRMWFQCRCTARSVDIISDDEDAGWSIEFNDSPLLMLDKLSRQPLLVYKKALGLYLKRHLSRPKDILAAFTGIGNRICSALGGSFVFGLPSSHFDWALLWEPKDAAVRRPKEDNEEFPSWSWCGWKKEIVEYKSQMLAGCEDNLHDWLMQHTWITWYIRDGNGNLRLVWDSKSTASPKLEPTWKGYGRENCGDDSAYDKYGRQIKESEKHLPRSADFKLILEDCPYDVEIVDCPDIGAPNSTEKDMPYLQFFTWSAFFRIRDDPRFPDVSGKNFRRYSIEDYKDDWCGTILLDKFWVEDQNLKNPLQFIAISDAKQFGNEEYDDWANYIPLERRESAWDLYYVLLIEYKKDIAYRVGLGKIYKEAFDNSCKAEGKQWKEFILG